MLLPYHSRISLGQDTRRQCTVTKAQTSAFRRLVDDIRECLVDVKGEVEMGNFRKTETSANISEMQRALRKLDEELNKTRCTSVKQPPLFLS